MYYIFIKLLNYYSFVSVGTDGILQVFLPSEVVFNTPPLAHTHCPPPAPLDHSQPATQSTGSSERDKADLAGAEATP